MQPPDARSHRYHQAGVRGVGSARAAGSTDVTTRYIVHGMEGDARVRKVFEAASAGEAEQLAIKIGVSVLAVEIDTGQPSPLEGAPMPAALGRAHSADAARPGAEETLWIDTPSGWQLFPWYALTALVAAAGVVGWIVLKGGAAYAAYAALALAAILLVVCGWKTIVLRTTQMMLTTQRLRIRAGVLTKRIEEVELYRVRDSQLTQSLWQRVLGLGTIVLETTDQTTPQVVLSYIRKPFDVREHLRHAAERVRRVQRVREIEMT